SCASFRTACLRMTFRTRSCDQTLTARAPRALQVILAPSTNKASPRLEDDTMHAVWCRRFCLVMATSREETDEIENRMDDGGSGDAVPFGGGCFGATGGAARRVGTAWVPRRELHGRSRRDPCRPPRRPLQGHPAGGERQPRQHDRPQGGLRQ